MQGWVVTRPWGLVHSTNTYKRIYVIQLQSATVRSLLVLRLWWKTIRSRGIECCFHCFVFSQSGNSQLISAKKIRQANFIHWQNTGKYQFNKALLWFPTQGGRICMHLYAFVGFESSLSGRSAYKTWQKHPQKMRWVDSSDSFSPGRALALVTLGTCSWQPKSLRVHLGIQKGSLCRQAPWKHKCSGSKNKIEEICIKPMESNWISASILPHDHINANPWCLPSKARYKVTAMLQCYIKIMLIHLELHAQCIQMITLN